MEIQKNLYTPLLQDKQQGDSDQLPRDHTKSLKFARQPSTSENQLKKKWDKLSHLIKDINELIPKGYCSLEDLKDTLEIKQEAKDLYEWGLSGFSASVNNVVVTSDDKYIVASDNRFDLIKVFEVETKREVMIFKKSYGMYSIDTLAVSDDNHYIVMTTNKKIECFDFLTFQQQPIFTIENAHEEKICTVAISKDNKFIITGSNDKCIKVFDISTRTEVHSFNEIHKGPILSIALSNDEKFLISGSADKSIKILDLKTKQEVHHFEDIHEDKVTSVVISTDDKYIFSLSKSIHVLSLETKKEIYHLKTKSETQVKAIAISRNNKFILTAEDKSIRVFNFETKEEAYLLENIHEDSILSLAVLKNKDCVITGAKDENIKIFDLESKQELFCFTKANTGCIEVVKLSNDNKFIVCGTSRNSVSIFDFETRKKIHSFEEAHTESVISVAISSKNKYIASGSYDDSINIFDFEKKELIHKFVNAHSGGINLTISNDEKFIVSGGYDEMVKIFDIEKKEEVYCFKNTHSGIVSSVCLSKGDEYLITGSYDRSIKVFDFDTKKLVHHFQEVHKDRIDQLVISDNNKYIISCSNDKTIKVLGLDTKEVIHEFQNVHLTPPKSICLTSYNKYIVSSSKDSIKLWDLEAFQELYEYKVAIDNQVSSVTVTNDNQFIVAGSYDGSLRVFRLETLHYGHDLKPDLGLNNIADSIGLFCVSKNEKRMVVATKSKIFVYDYDTKLELFNQDFPNLRKINISNDGKYLVCGIEEHMSVLDLDTRQEIFSTDIPFEAFFWVGLQISNNNKFVVAWSLSLIQVYDIDAKLKCFEVNNDNDKIGLARAVVISSDNKYVIVGTDGADIIIYDIQAHKKVFTFNKVQDSDVNSLAISNNSIYLVIGFVNNSIKMFDLETKKEVLHLDGALHDSPRPTMIFSDDDRYVIIRESGLAKIVDLSVNRIIQWLRVDYGRDDFLHISKDNTQIMTGAISYEGECFMKTYQTLFDFSTFVSSKINPELQFVNYAALLLNNNEPSTRNKFLLAYNDLYVFPHIWTTLHLLAIYDPSYISHMPKFAEFKVPFLVDKYGKTPLHYLLSHNTLDFTIVNIMLEYILDFIEDKRKTNIHESRMVTDSLSNLFLFIVSKTPPRLSYKYLNLCYPETSAQYKETLPPFGNSEQKYTLTKVPAMGPAVRAEVYKEGDDRIVFRTNMIKLDYQPASDDMLMTNHVLSEIKDGQIFKLPIIENLIDHLWDSTKKVITYTALAFSLLMILFSMYVGIGQRSLLMEIMITLLTLGFISMEIIQMTTLKNEYFKTIWNWVDLAMFGLIIAYMYTRFSNNQNFLTQSWMSTIIIILGYLRWISYLRLFTPTRHLIEIILVVLYDMLGFMTIIASILIGFSLIFLQFSRNQEEEPQEYPIHFYKTYQLMFGNYDDSDFSFSQTLLTSLLLLVLNVVLLNLLISVIGDSYGKVKEKQELVDALSRLDMVGDAIVLMRKLRRNQTSEKGYLIYCLPATVEDESLESMEWKARMDEIKKLLTQTENEMKKNMKEEVAEIKSKMEEQIGEVHSTMGKMQEEIGQVRMEVQAFGKLIMENFNELTKSLKQTAP